MKATPKTRPEKSLLTNWVAVTREARKKRDYWCFGRGAKKGDVIFIYEIKVGFTGVERLTTSPAMGGECDFYGLLTSKTAEVRRFKKPVAIETMRSDKILREMGALKRNFQGTVFAITPAQAAQILRLG